MRKQAAGECLSAVCHTVPTQMWHPPGNGLEARSGEPSARFRSQKGWTKAIIVRSKKTGIKWTFKQLLDCTILSPMERIMQILPPIFCYQDLHSGCVPAVLKNFPDGLRLTISHLQCKRDGTDIWMWFPFYCVCGAFPLVTSSGEILSDK